MATWNDLRAHAEAVSARPIGALFASNPERSAEFSAAIEGLALDFSRTNLDHEGLGLLLDLARARGVEARRDAMFAGARINESEGRAVLHWALRDPDGPPLLLDDGSDARAVIRETLEAMEEFVREVRTGEVMGTGGPITDVVNIGIGGSHLGPEMAAGALSPWADGPRAHFVSNIDGADIHDRLRRLDPRRTLVIVASKTFTTLETMRNARVARRWLEQGGGGMHQLVAVSSATERARAFGVPPAQIFSFGDYVGGRYSLWGPIGLPVMLAVGAGHFRAFLEGGREVDVHFRTAPLERNLPVLLALVGIWHAQVLGWPTRAVIPYEQRLARLPAYLQQLEMESNGKRVTLSGAPAAVDTGPIVWGEPGTNAQHAFFQLLHQGTRVVPVEFLLGARGNEPKLEDHHHLLVANCLAQAEALMRGRSLEEARALVARAGLEGEAAERLAAQRSFPGNRPSVLILYPRLSPATLGRIIALYEHRVFVEGVVLGINSFDQWGVELGKELATALVPAVAGETEAEDPATRATLAQLRAMGLGPAC